jgi:hypothetical protein
MGGFGWSNWRFRTAQITCHALFYWMVIIMPAASCPLLNMKREIRRRPVNSWVPLVPPQVAGRMDKPLGQSWIFTGP